MKYPIVTFDENSLSLKMRGREETRGFVEAMLSLIGEVGEFKLKVIKKKNGKAENKGKLCIGALSRGNFSLGLILQAGLKTGKVECFLSRDTSEESTSRMMFSVVEKFRNKFHGNRFFIEDYSEELAGFEASRPKPENTPIIHEAEEFFEASGDEEVAKEVTPFPKGFMKDPAFQKAFLEAIFLGGGDNFFDVGQVKDWYENYQSDNINVTSPPVGKMLSHLKTLGYLKMIKDRPRKLYKLTDETLVALRGGQAPEANVALESNSEPNKAPVKTTGKLARAECIYEICKVAGRLDEAYKKLDQLIRNLPFHDLHPLDVDAFDQILERQQRGDFEEDIDLWKEVLEREGQS